jgi:peptidoglycan/LPS O-acetylase OafA/YrhL
MLSPDRNEISFAGYKATTFRPGFDGLRAVGFLLVVTAHVPAVWPFAYLQGWTAVWIFFAISGYLVTMLLIREERKSGAIAYGPFLIRRFFRIIPSYAAVLALYWIVLASLPPLAGDYQQFRQELPYHLTLMTEYIDSPVFSIFIHAWAVGVETKFYVLFPPLVFLLIRNDMWRFVATLAAAVLLTATAPLMPSAQVSFVNNAWCAILAGVLLAQILEWPRGFAFVAALTRVPAAVPLAFVVALFVLLRYVEVLPAVAAVAAYVVAHVTMRDSVMRRLLGWGPLVYLGKRSYGAYLLHVLAIHLGYVLFGSATVTASGLATAACGTVPCGLLTAAFALAVTIPAAELLYRIVEQPGMTLARRLTEARAG